MLFSPFLVEQFNLQRQLEMVQAQHQQLLAQQQQLSQGGFIPQQPSMMNVPGTNAPQSYMSNSGTFGQFSSAAPTPPPGFGPTGHRRIQSSIPGTLGPPQNMFDRRNNNSNDQNQAHGMGHSRRHSLGISEAKKAAALVQSQRSSGTDSSSSASVPVPVPVPIQISAPTSNATSAPSFKFPPTPIQEVDTPVSPNPPPNAHSRSQSLAYGQNQRSSYQRPSYQFPPMKETTPTIGPIPSHVRGGSNQYGHGRSSSSNNWRQSQNLQSKDYLTASAFTPSHAGRGSVSSSSGFQGGYGNQRKSLFAPYLPQSSLPGLIAEGKLVTGILRVNKKNRSDAYVATDGLLDADIFICGSKDRNRALEGDLVAIELLVVDEVWESKKTKEEKKRRKDAASSSSNVDIRNDASTLTNTNSNSSGNNGSTGLQRKGSLKQRPTQKKNDDVEVEGQSLLLVEEEEISDDYKPLYTGHVVAVVDRIPGQLFSGTLGLLRPSQASKRNDDNKKNDKPKIVWFKPTDKKVPLIAIPTEQAPADFVENHQKYADKLFVASIKRWPITSLHPFGNLVGEIGTIDNRETEVVSIMRDNNFMCDEYPNELDTNYVPEGEEPKVVRPEDLEYLETIPDPETYVIPKDISEKRRDFSDEYVLAFSADGLLSDQAFHIKKISEERIELAIHISDVTSFIDNKSVLDKKAKKRSTTVFLAQKAAHMLPSKLNKLVSFAESKASLAITISFEIDTESFEVKDVWIGESVIKPKKLLSYNLLDKVILNEAISKGDVPSKDKLNSASIDYIKTLALVSREFKRQRLHNQELDDSHTLSLLDQLDDEPVSLSLNIYETKPSTRVINEILIKVNTAVAEKLFAKLGNKAFLRRQPLPTLQAAQSFIKKAKALGYNLNTASSSTLQNGIFKVKDVTIRNALQTLLIKCMSRGKYFVPGKCDAENTNHYIFDLAVYTHFTSPLRRYADHIVHRQLKAILLNTVEDYEETEDSLKMAADYCNFKKDCAKSAQDQSIHLILSHTINDMSKTTGQLICMGTIIQVYESAFDVYIPDFGIEKRVHGDQLPLKKAEFDKSSRVLELYWEKDVDSATFIPEDERVPFAYHKSIKNRYRASSIASAAAQGRASIEGKLGLNEDATKNLDIGNLSLNSKSTSGSPDDSGNDNHSKSMPSSPAHGATPQVDILQSPIDAPQRTSSLTLKSGLSIPGSLSNPLSSYLESTLTRVENEDYIQEIRELKQVPVLLRAEIGMALPCLTVRAINPFFKG